MTNIRESDGKCTSICVGRLNVLIITLMFVSLLAGCNESGHSSSCMQQTPCVSQFSSASSMEDDEASLMAIYISGELSAPENLIDEIDCDLEQIRNEVETAREIFFRPPWNEKRLIVGFDDVAAADVTEGLYHEWDSLNEEFGVSGTDLGLIERGVAILKFSESINPLTAGKYYSQLPGIEYAEPDHAAGDCPNIYPLRSGGRMTYLVYNACGDSASGCIDKEYWYFGGDNPGFIGHWEPRTDPSEPDWWTEAEKNLDAYLMW